MKNQRIYFHENRCYGRDFLVRLKVFLSFKCWYNCCFLLLKIEKSVKEESVCRIQKETFNYKLLERKALAVCGLGNQVPSTLTYGFKFNIYVCNYTTYSFEFDTIACKFNIFAYKFNIYAYEFSIYTCKLNVATRKVDF